MTYFSWQTPSMSDMMLLVSLGLLGGFAFILQTVSYNFAPASVVAPMAYSAMIWAVIFGFVFWGEIPNLALVIGDVLIIGSGYYIIRRESEKKV
jgi:drug/metabolite transporter (DMT)-like permease